MEKIKVSFRICVVIMLFVWAVAGCKKIEPSYSADKEAVQIKSWVDTMIKNKNNIDTTSTGLLHIVEKVGTGPTVQAGDTVTVKYTGAFLDGTVFDFSTDFVYIHKVTGQRMIMGWEEAIETLSKGGSAIFLIPSAKAYGKTGYVSIPPYTPLLFRFEVVDIR